jgi:pantoate--beta-alanine ligase
LTPALTKTIPETRLRIAPARKAAKSIGFVPTMGALHEGHRKLIQTARETSDFVIVSIFVNPLQFGPTEDYGRYPRALPSDLDLCGRAGADLVFAPAVEDMYPEEQLTFAEVTKVSDNLCGAFRPGHFRGVATVVLKLFNIVQPDRAYFGEKDMQQLTVIRRMARDLSLPIVIIGVPTVREPDGLAMSSRNQYLDPSQRLMATVLYRALLKSREAAQAGERDAVAVRSAGLDVLRGEPLVRIQYFELVDENMQPVDRIAPGVRAAGAVLIGNTRLIDNILCL